MEEKEKDKRRQAEGRTVVAKRRQKDDRNQGNRTKKSGSAAGKPINFAYLLGAALYFNLLTEFIVSPRTYQGSGSP